MKVLGAAGLKIDAAAFPVGPLTGQDIFAHEFN